MNVDYLYEQLIDVVEIDVVVDLMVNQVELNWIVDKYLVDLH